MSPEVRVGLQAFYFAMRLWLVLAATYGLIFYGRQKRFGVRDWLAYGIALLFIWWVLVLGDWILT